MDFQGAASPRRGLADFSHPHPAGSLALWEFACPKCNELSTAPGFPAFRGRRALKLVIWGAIATTSGPTPRFRSRGPACHYLTEAGHVSIERTLLLFFYKKPVLAALLASTTLVTACTGSTAKDNAEPLDPSAGSTADVQLAKANAVSTPQSETNQNSWLLAQMEYRCVRSKGGTVPDAVFQQPPPLKSMAKPQPNRWLTAPGMELTTEAQDPTRRKAQGKRDQHKEVSIPHDQNTEMIRVGVPPQSITLTSADGAVIEYVTSGCVGQAIQQLFGKSAEVYYTTRLQVGDIHRTHAIVENKPAIRELDERYSECMKKRGQGVDSVTTGNKQLLHELQRVDKGESSVEKLRSLEKEYVSADKVCRQQERIAEVYAHHYLQELQKATKEAQSAIAAHKEMSEHAARVRQEYLAKHHL